jgi:hypothetical protein
MSCLGKEDDMDRWKEWSVVPILLWLALSIGLTNAQEEGYDAIKSPTPPETGDGIHNGLFIYNGVKVPQPYFVAMRDDTIYINDIPFSPRRRDPSELPRKIVVTELAKRKHEFLRSLQAKSGDYYRKYGKDKAQQMIQDEFGSDTLVTEMIFNDEGVNKIKWKDGMVEDVGAFRESFRKMTLTPEELQKNRLRIVEYIGNTLRGGDIKAIGYKYDVAIPKRTFDEMNSIINKIRNGKLTVIEGKDQMHKICNSGLVDDIFKNLDSWK